MSSPQVLDSTEILGPLFNITLVDDYFMLYRTNDMWFIKAGVYFVMLAEVIQLVLMTHLVYTTFVIGYGGTKYLLKTPWSSPATPALNGISEQGLFILFSLLGTDMSIFQCGCSIGVTIKYMMYGRHPSRFTDETTIMMLWLSGSLFCDILIATVMVYLLKESKKKILYKTSKAMINTLIVGTVETGAITVLFAVLDMAFFLKAPRNFLHICFMYILGRVFSNVLLAALNGRHRVHYSGRINEFSMHQGSTHEPHAIEFKQFPTSSMTISQPSVGRSVVPIHEVTAAQSHTHISEDTTARADSVDILKKECLNN
ncbi:hypothetical protein BDQ12DRAFT_668463 [Crucibulum laeve]|uniref:DUF6534 domain-containing protein n=1 Tax=Crucibulum laeve TaxID=68775 RepID=A0A5C3LT81_9AGAR|nr:hypothetical protein BDQ12DRAFT_668463 [Crucibulum laeve]